MVARRLIGEISFEFEVAYPKLENFVTEDSKIETI
jgi:hypothetical protein